MQLVDVASRLYHHELVKGVGSSGNARYYLGERRVFGKAMEVFRLGFAPRTMGDPWIKRKLEGVSTGTLLEAGLLTEGQNGLVDPMGGRVIFPQTTPAGQVVGFMGRAIDPSVSEGYKYVSTAQTPLFRKAEILYRIDMAYRPIMSEQKAIVVEGPLDAVLLWQIGQHNVVATGTARMTDAQAQILARYTKKLEVMFDSDDAGDAAFDQLRRQRGQFFQSVERRLVPVPFKDPAEWIRSVIDRRLAG